MGFLLSFLSLFLSVCVLGNSYQGSLFLSLSGVCCWFSLCLCVSVAVAGVRCWVFVGVVSEVVECWGYFAFFFLAEKIQRFLGGCSLLRESFRLGGCLIVAPEERTKRNSYLGFFFFFFL